MQIVNSLKQSKSMWDKKVTIISHYIKRTQEDTLEKDIKNQNLGFLSANKRMEK